MFLVCYLISLDTRPDLSDAEPANVAMLCGWPALRQPALEGVVPKNGSAVSMLGYMMDGYQFVNDGDPVTMFVLMPAAGHFLHPAHRDPGAMVEIWPAPKRVIFKSRELVWASGTFERLPEPPGEDHALYALRCASIAPASYDDIHRWFAPPAHFDK